MHSLCQYWSWGHLHAPPSSPDFWHYIHHATYLHHIYRILISSELKPTSLAFLSSFFSANSQCMVIMVFSGRSSGYLYQGHSKRERERERACAGQKVDSLKWQWKMGAAEEKNSITCGMQAVMSPWNNFSMIKWVAPTIPLWWQYLKTVNTTESQVGGCEVLVSLTCKTKP